MGFAKDPEPAAPAPPSDLFEGHPMPAPGSSDVERLNPQNNRLAPQGNQQFYPQNGMMMPGMLPPFMQGFGGFGMMGGRGFPLMGGGQMGFPGGFPFPEGFPPFPNMSNHNNAAPSPHNAPSPAHAKGSCVHCSQPVFSDQERYQLPSGKYPHPPPHVKSALKHGSAPAWGEHELIGPSGSLRAPGEAHSLMNPISLEIREKTTADLVFKGGVERGEEESATESGVEQEQRYSRVLSGGHSSKKLSKRLSKRQWLPEDEDDEHHHHSPRSWEMSDSDDSDDDEGPDVFAT